MPIHEKDVLLFFAQYGHIQVCALLRLVYITLIVSRYLDIDIIKLSLDLGKLLTTQARAGRPSSLRAARTRTGVCSSSYIIHIVSRYLDLNIIKLSLDTGQPPTAQVRAADYAYLRIVQTRTGIRSSLSCMYKP